MDAARMPRFPPIGCAATGTVPAAYYGQTQPPSVTFQVRFLVGELSPEPCHDGETAIMRGAFYVAEILRLIANYVGERISHEELCHGIRHNLAKLQQE